MLVKWFENEHVDFLVKTKIVVIIEQNCKGQYISKAIYGVLNSPKNERWDNLMY